MTTTYNLTRWSLDDLFPAHDSSELEAAFEELETKVGQFEALREDLVPEIDFEEFMDAVKGMEKITALFQRVSSYAGLLFSEDTQNQEAQALEARVQQFTAELYNRVLFFELWWKELDDENAERLMARSDGYRYWLE
jgi:oligoendopeptidase F